MKADTLLPCQEAVTSHSEITDLLPLKPIWLHLLMAMASGHRHGYAMRKDVERRTDGQMKVWPATLYRVTDRGRAVLAAEMGRPESLVSQARGLNLILDAHGRVA